MSEDFNFCIWGPRTIVVLLCLLKTLRANSGHLWERNFEHLCGPQGEQSSVTLKPNRISEKEVTVNWKLSVEREEQRVPVVGLQLGLPRPDVPFPPGESLHRQHGGHAGGWRGLGHDHVPRDQLRRCRYFFLILVVSLEMKLGDANEFQWWRQRRQ